ncbi:MAG: hydantoinase B/oxoprolinase family protein [Chloroflexi bacterium]|nr:hydantoinase B/oxoprolinase family protein [Chloroflexota bacterium]
MDALQETTPTLARRASLFDDPVTLEIIWGRLVTAADEMQAVLRRTAFSTIVAVANDLGCEIMDARGWSVAHATTSNPAFNLTLPQLVQKLLPIFPPESLKPGDVLVTNDPWLVVGHSPDFGVVTPFFKHGRLVGFAGSIAHVADIGGLLNAQLARSIFEEGLLIPPARLYEAGRRNEMLVSIIERNVRAPEMVMGDITALVMANAAAARQTLALLDEYGLDDLDALSNAVQARAERAMRKAIDEIPDGDYSFETTFDELDGPMTIGGAVRVRGSDLVVEFTRVPPEHPHGGINCTPNYTPVRCNYVLNCILAPQIPGSEGLFRPITVRIPEGTILAARFPASVNDRTKVGWHADPIIFGALAQAIPEKVPASSGLKSLFRLLGVDDNGVAFRSFMFNGGGMGAGAATDGVHAICYPTSASNVPIEILESLTSVLVAEKEFLPDSAGAGRQRGGCGVRVTIGVHDDLDRPLIVGAAFHNQEYPAFGLAGGRDAAPTRARMDGRPLAVGEIRHELGAYALDDPDVRITLETAGGGGFGEPAERDPARVFADVRAGFVSAEAATRVYGVEIDLERVRANRRGGTELSTDSGSGLNGLGPKGDTAPAELKCRCRRHVQTEQEDPWLFQARP